MLSERRRITTKREKRKGSLYPVAVLWYERAGKRKMGRERRNREVGDSGRRQEEKREKGEKTYKIPGSFALRMYPLSHGLAARRRGKKPNKMEAGKRRQFGQNRRKPACGSL